MPVYTSFTPENIPVHTVLPLPEAVKQPVAVLGNAFHITQKMCLPPDDEDKLKLSRPPHAESDFRQALEAFGKGVAGILLPFAYDSLGKSKTLMPSFFANAPHRLGMNECLYDSTSPFPTPFDATMIFHVEPHGEAIKIGYGISGAAKGDGRPPAAHLLRAIATREGYLNAQGVKGLALREDEPKVGIYGCFLWVAPAEKMIEVVQFGRKIAPFMQDEIKSLDTLQEQDAKKFYRLRLQGIVEAAFER